MFFWSFEQTMQVKLREMKPGQLSQELKEALGMPDGAPPPWLINMQVSTIVYCVVLNISLPTDCFQTCILPCWLLEPHLPALCSELSRYCRISTVTIGYLILCLWKNYFAEIRSSTFLSAPEDSWIECTYSRGCIIWLPCWRLGQASC